VSAKNRRLSELRRNSVLVVHLECSAVHLLAGVITDAGGPLVVRSRGTGMDPTPSGTLPVACSCASPASRKIDLAALRGRFDLHDPGRLAGWCAGRFRGRGGRCSGRPVLPDLR
jgi:hypothetical protein